MEITFPIKETFGQTAHGVIQNIVKHKHDARIVGGAVRDTLMGYEPKDIDIATTALPETVIEMFTPEDGWSVVPTGLQHGTVTVVSAETGEAIEVTTLRLDINTDGRHAQVQFTDDWEADAARRDFTMNALSVDHDGTLHDYFGGQQDITDLAVRFIGDPIERIREDYLRILRYFRFRTKMGPPYGGGPEYRKIIEEALPNLKQISGERIWMELSKILPNSFWTHRVLREMEIIGAFRAIGFNTSFDYKAAQLTALITDDPVVILMTGMVEDRQNMMRVLEDHYKVSSEELKKARSLNRLMDMYKPQEVPTDINDLMRFTVVHGKAETLDLLAMMNRNQSHMFVSRWNVPIFPLMGRDLIQIGHKPGPAIGNHLDDAKTHWIERLFRPTKTDLIRVVGRPH